MGVIQFGEYLFHDCLPVQYGLGADPEAFTIKVDGSHFAVIQINDLPVFSHKRFLLFLEVFRIDADRGFFLASSHGESSFLLLKFRAKLAFYCNIIAIFVTDMRHFKNIFVRI